MQKMHPKSAVDPPTCPSTVPTVILLIVESPTKAGKIRGFLGPEYRVAASFGHVRDLPPSGGLAVRFADGQVLPQYMPLDKAARAIAELRALSAKAERVLLASDPDREGEAIAWHVAALLGRDDCQRVVFHAITKPAVLAALAAPRAVDQHLVDAQQARRVLDRVVGWIVSPTLRRLGKEAKSAGRVQSVALRLVAEREREIQRFTVVDHFVPWITVTKPGTPPPFTARCIQWKGEALGTRLVQEDLATRTVEWVRKQTFVVQRCERAEQERRPPPPFTTATVQQAASVQLKLAPDATMKLLQSLFEDGHITYHRTDSVALDPAAITEARAVIAARFPKSCLPDKPVIHQGKAANAQEAHEAIRPTHPADGPERTVGPAGQALYTLIWSRFIACQMSSARDEHTTIDVACAPGTWQGGPMGVFQAKGTVERFAGWRTVGADATDESAVRKRGRRPKGEAAPDDDEKVKLPLLHQGDAVDLTEAGAKQTSTKPPPRYTQASLIKKLEHDGIGRPSTYAAILGTIMTRGYVDEEKRKLLATDLGMRVTDFLLAKYAGNFIDYAFTAQMESTLDAIARGERPWQTEVTTATFEVLRLAKAAGLWFDPLAEDSRST